MSADGFKRAQPRFGIAHGTNFGTQSSATALLEFRQCFDAVARSVEMVEQFQENDWIDMFAACKLQPVEPLLVCHGGAGIGLPICRG